MLARPLAFRRAINNLVGNAASHGEKVRLSARPLPSGGLEILVEDDGPGIPDDMHEEAFRPFSRLDASRNQNRKGVGLGLAVARDVARSHGGDITLGRSDLGGLKASIRLPADRRAA
jgi:two-component system osmolarity sensor histidine kinase EnvZ